MTTETDAGDTATDRREPADEHTRVVEVPLAEADVERIKLEIEQNSDAPYAPETVEEWIKYAVRMLFAQIDTRADEVRAHPQVDVPPVMARRAELDAESARQRGGETTIDDILINNVGYYPEWCVDGEPIKDRSAGQEPQDE